MATIAQQLESLKTNNADLNQILRSTQAQTQTELADASNRASYLKEYMTLNQELTREVQGIDRTAWQEFLRALAAGDTPHRWPSEEQALPDKGVRGYHGHVSEHDHAEGSDQATGRASREPQRESLRAKPPGGR